MTVVDGKITSCTDWELYNYWLTRGLYYFYTYPDYKLRMLLLGVEVREENHV